MRSRRHRGLHYRPHPDAAWTTDPGADVDPKVRAAVEQSATEWRRLLRALDVDCVLVLLLPSRREHQRHMMLLSSVPADDTTDVLRAALDEED